MRGRLNELVNKLKGYYSYIAKYTKNSYFISSDYRILSESGYDTSLENITSEWYIDDLFKIRESVGVDIIFSDLRELSEKKSYEDKKSFLERVLSNEVGLVKRKGTDKVDHLIHYKDESFTKLYLEKNGIFLISNFVIYIHKEDDKVCLHDFTDKENLYPLGVIALKEMYKRQVSLIRSGK